MSNINLTINKLAGLEFLSKFEQILIFIQALIFILIMFPFINMEIKIYIFLVSTLISIIKLIIFNFRRLSNKYISNYLTLLGTYGGQIILVISLTLISDYEDLLNNILVIIFFILACINGFLNLKFTIKYLFYLHLKTLFPKQGIEHQVEETALKDLAPFISINKQEAFLLIRYVTFLTIYGYYIFICLLAFKFTDFSSLPFLNQLHNYISSWSILNLSNAIGLFSISLALLTICIPAQQKILEEAEDIYNATTTDIERHN